MKFGAPIPIFRIFDEAKARARKLPPRHMGDRLKRLFYKNALFEVVARKKTGTTPT